ncbi:MAG: ribonuclease III [Deltaproteobacteria bacterium]|nr:ribonuclease III [Deltaproteobacteria bacterium]
MIDKHFSELIQGASKDIGYKFKNSSLLLEALTHKSYANENKLNYNNERLEYLGDSIIDFAIAYILFNQFSKSNEGLLSRFRAALVNEKKLSEIARRINLNKYIILGKGERLTSGNEKDSILCGTYEAVIAAIFLDSNLNSVLKIVKKHFEKEFENITSKDIMQDYKTAILIFCQEKYKITPSYELVSQTGPDHDCTFEVKIMINGSEYGRGSGKTKKEAEQQAAKEAIYKIVSSHREDE